MSKVKAQPKEVVTFEVALKNRAVLTVKANNWNFGSAYGYSGPLLFNMGSDLVLSVHPAKWEYVKRVGSEIVEE